MIGFCLITHPGVQDARGICLSEVLLFRVVLGLYGDHKGSTRNEAAEDCPVLVSRLPMILTEAKKL